MHSRSGLAGPFDRHAVKAAQRQVLYTSVKNKMGFCYIHTGVIQRAKGYTALARLAYQTCGSVNDGFRRVSYRAYAAHHLGGLVLLPRHAPAELADLLEFVAAVGLRENRRDAQEGRIVDFAIPRQVPPELLLAVAAFVLLPFVELGMSIRIDVECPPASDGQPNPTRARLFGNARGGPRRLRCQGTILEPTVLARRRTPRAVDHCRATYAGLRHPFYRRSRRSTAQ